MTKNADYFHARAMLLLLQRDRAFTLLRKLDPSFDHQDLMDEAWLLLPDHWKRLLQEN